MNMKIKMNRLKEIIYEELLREDARLAKAARTRKKDEPFGEDPLGKKERKNALRLDTDVAPCYDANRKKRLARRRRRPKKKTNEELTQSDREEIRDLIRSEVSEIFFDLFKLKQVWK